VRILFDQGTPVPLRKLLNPHHVETAFERGWSTLGNGELLAVAEQEGFEVFVTTDRNLRDQQDLRGGSIAIAVMEYVYLVPHVEESDHVFLKTIIPSRKATRDYGRRGEK
jgi:hypothetical protein